MTALSPETSDVLRVVAELSEETLNVYRAAPRRVEEDANSERRISQGGYHEHSLRELVQNGVDELQEEGGGRIHVVLTRTHLYCANTGNPVTPQGAETILRMGVSRKRGGQIGRFGVGVKSVLSVTDTPEFFSATGSFGFDREWSAARIREVQPHAAETPVLRMGRPLDIARERSTDPVLDELLKEAVTVVRLPLLPGAAGRLAREIETFPTTFALFASRVKEAVLEDRRALPVRRVGVSVDREQGECTLRQQQAGQPVRNSQWHVFHKAHTPSAEVQGTAGELHSRPVIDVSWAVPRLTVGASGNLSAANSRGRFWAYFPTTYDTTLSGMLNAAWKTSEDRGALYEGSPFNQELLRVAAELVVESLPALVPANDPGAYLPLLPGRTKESPNWADKYLVEHVWQAAARHPSLPDQTGTLQRPSDLHVHPKGLSLDHLRMWAEYDNRPANWVHHSVEAHPNRHGKMEHILLAAKQEPEDVVTWLEALVGDGSPEASACAIRIAARLLEENHSLAAEARTAKIVLTEKHGLVAPVANKVFRRAVDDGLRHDMVYVAPRVVEILGMTGPLDRLGIHEADAQGRFLAVVEQGFSGYDDQSWRRFWELLRSAGGIRETNRIKAVVPRPLETLRVLTLDGRFRPMRDCLVPGAVVPGDKSRDTSIAVDMGFHGDDRPVFRELGLLDRPALGKVEEEDWFDEYRQAMHKSYCASLPGTANRPAIGRMHLEGSPCAGSLHLLPRLSEEGRARFVEALPDAGVIGKWTLQIGNSAATRTAVSSPLRWWVRREGRAAVDLRTGGGTVTVFRELKDCVGPQLSTFADLLPVARRELGGEKASKLGLATTLDAVPQRMWNDLLDRVLESTDDEFVGRAYALLLRMEAGFPEDVETRCRVGGGWETRPDAEIAVTASRAEYDALVRESVPALLVPGADDVQRMLDEWGMLRVSDVITKELRHVAVGEAVPLVEVFPALRARFGKAVTGKELLRCSELEEVVRTPNGSRATPLKSALKDQNTVLVLDTADENETLFLADQELGWRLGRNGCKQLLEAHRRQQEDRKVRQALEAVRRAESVIDKILLLVGAEALRSKLPEGLLDSEIQETGRTPDARRIAELAYHAHGDEVLRQHSKDVAENFPANAPAQFSGSTAAVRFVTDLGFPESFAGMRAPSLEPRLLVNGPVEFPGLHPYQERMASNLFDLLDRRAPQRGMLCLPTGAGKTRVTAEAVIRWIKSGGNLGKPVLWIAQTEELCEQAVQSWSFVWSKVGARGELAISRLWSTNEAANVTGRPHLVVATDAKLTVCLERPEYAWLRDAALVVVDEAHVAITKSYTAILTSMGLTSQRTERHLVGLTATPYRGTNEEETRRLVLRFGSRRIDEGVFETDPYAELQKLGMLARVESRELDGGTIELSSNELEASRMGLLPKSAEQRLADDHQRNTRLVDEIVAVHRDGPVLLFATSVAHARVMAAKLKDRGVRAEAIDAATPIAGRRERISQFREGKIQVLTNYGVLTQGFDAPATRTVVVARPTYSPNVYQQMIGRGLRGPKNGGKETCLILNVRDNILNHGEDLAFTRFEYLWNAQ
ncbi:DEAD/DEAH box helicase family protein [Streptomyces sp. NPDC059506]|uniref:DEAD/DEAH box helicase n=1 Tax=Streptomyces TaxID=1883 RepID=UPI0036778739